MKFVKVKSYQDTYWRMRQKIIVDWKEVWSANDLSECPEDATLYRDMTNAHQMVSFARYLHWEDFEVKIEDCETQDEFEND